MAKISAKKSNLKTIANKIIVSPSTAVVSDLKFKRRKDFSTFVKWIDSSNKALAGIKLPSKKEVEKLGKGSGGSNWLLGLLGLLGLGGLGIAASKKGGSDSESSDGVDGANPGVTIPKLFQGPNIAGALDITRQLGDPNIRKNNKINKSNKKIDLKNKNTLKTNLKNAKIKSNWIKNLKSNTLRNKFWNRGGTKPNVTNLGERMKSVQLKHGSKTMKVGSGTFSATKAQAPLIPDSLSKGMLDKKPTLKTSFKTNIKNLFTKGGIKNLGKGFLVGWAADEFIEKPLLNAVDAAGNWGSRKIIDSQVTKHGAPKVLAKYMKNKEEFASKKKVNWGMELLTGRNEFNQKMVDKFQLDIEYIKTKYKDQLNTIQAKNIIKSGEEVTVPFPVITSSNSGGDIVPVPVGGSNSNGSSNSSMMAMSGGVNSSLTDLLLSRLG